MLINNESEKEQGIPVDAIFILDGFYGTGLAVLYRQDHWYGMLKVEIDGESPQYINQYGPPGTLGQACYEVSGNGPHRLVLSGSVAGGVITIYKIL